MIKEEAIETIKSKSPDDAEKLLALIQKLEPIVRACLADEDKSAEPMDLTSSVNAIDEVVALHTQSTFSARSKILTYNVILTQGEAKSSAKKSACLGRRLRLRCLTVYRSLRQNCDHLHP